MEVLHAALSINMGVSGKKEESLVYHTKCKHPHNNVMQTFDTKTKQNKSKNHTRTHKDLKTGHKWLNRSFGSVRHIIAFWYFISKGKVLMVKFRSKKLRSLHVKKCELLMNWIRVIKAEQIPSWLLKVQSCLSFI